MNVSLTPELEKYINDKVASGRYASASEVVREALRVHEEREQKLASLRADIEEGLRSLEEHGSIEATPEYWDDLIRRGRAAVEARQQEQKRKAS